MKKLALLIGCVFMFTNCTIDDDDGGPRIVSIPAEVTNATLPESFEEGETYEIDVTYLLPSACHTAAGLRVTRGGANGEQYRDIYVVGFASYDANLAECNEEDSDLEGTGTFTITIDDNEPFTFYLWTGVDVDNENVFDTIEVPVMEAEGNGENSEG